MPLLVIDDAKLLQAISSSPEQYIKSVILENNKTFELMHDDRRMCWVLVCENKPRNIYGIFWEELNGRE